MSKKLALLSVSDKTGIVEFATSLQIIGFDIVSTGGTQQVLTNAGITTLSVEELTQFPEMMDGRVKTLHPMVHGGLLARRDDSNHLEALEIHGIRPIDLVCVNLYPFKETIQKADVTFTEAIENIDIGGPSMLRSAAKNHESVTVLVDASDYSLVLEEMTLTGDVSNQTRQRLAAKAFRHTASYDAVIANYLTAVVSEELPESLTISYDLKQSLRYGENSHQSATYYEAKLPTAYSMGQAQKLHGKELSYNNIRDADAAIRLLSEFDTPTAVAVKHMNPCGIGTGNTIQQAFRACYDSDTISIFGGIVAVNRPVDLELAEILHRIFLEIVIAPSFTTEALEILSQKKNIRLLQLETDQEISAHEKEYTSVLGGLLVQELDHGFDQVENWEVVTDRKPTAEEIAALKFAWAAVKHIKSNAIVITNAHQTLGVGAGQMNRVGALKIALEQASHRLENAVIGSDAFFPMSDSIELAGKSGIKAVIQPGGSIKDQDSIDMANRYDMTMIFTKTRHFKH